MKGKHTIYTNGLITSWFRHWQYILSLLDGFNARCSFRVFCIVAFLTVLITYFGVNFRPGGMHSYANGQKEWQRSIATML